MKYISRILFLLTLALLLTAAFAPAHTPPALAQTGTGTTVAERWFHPNLIDQYDANGNPDKRNYKHFDTLFPTENESDSDYAQVLQEIDVWGFFGTTIAHNPGGWLERWVPLANKYGVKTSMEAGALPWATRNANGQIIYNCDYTTTGALVAQNELTWIDSIYTLQGHLDYLQMDNPFGRLMKHCSMTGAQMNSVIYQYMVTIHQQHPDIQIGMTVAYPNFSAFGTTNYYGKNTLAYNNLFQNLVTALNANGEHIAFLHTDSPFEFMNCANPNHGSNCSSIDWWNRLKKLEQLSESNSVPFGAIYNSALSQWNTTETDAQYYNRTVTYLNTYKSQGTSPANYVFESWHILPSALVPPSTPYTGLWDANQIFQNARGTCNGIPGLIC